MFVLVPLQSSIPFINSMILVLEEKEICGKKHKIKMCVAHKVAITMHTHQARCIETQLYLYC